MLGRADAFGTGPKRSRARTNSRDLHRYIRTSDRILWLAQPVYRAGDKRQAAHDRPITGVDAGCPNAHEHIALTDLGLGDVPKIQHLGAAVRVLNDGFHRGSSCRSCANLGRNHWFHFLLALAGTCAYTVSLLAKPSTYTVSLHRTYGVC